LISKGLQLLVLPKRRFQYTIRQSLNNKLGDANVRILIYKNRYHRCLYGEMNYTAMKISVYQITGIALVVAAALAIIALQTSGHGMMSVIDHPPTPPDVAAHGGTLINRVTTTMPLSFRILKWTAVVGLICICIPRRERTNA
jgi:hypothetical protein